MIDFAILLLMTVLLLESIFWYRMQYDFFQPVGIFLMTMIISNCIMLLNQERWGLNITDKTFFVVFTELTLYVLGAFWADYILQKKSTEEKDNGNDYIYCSGNEYNFPYREIMILSILLMVCLVFSTKEIYDLSLGLGNHSGFTNMIKTVRYPLERGEIQFSRWMNYRYILAYSIASVCVFLFCRNIFCGKFSSKYLCYLIPVVLYVPFSILTTGRRELIHFFLTVTILVGLLYLKINGYSPRAKVIVGRNLLIMAIISICFFFVLGHLTGKVTTNNRDYFFILSHYLGLSLPALDRFLSLPLLENTYIGQNTLRGVYSNLNTLGANLQPGKGFLDFVQFNGVTTNVYTVFRRQIADYGIVGTSVLSFMWGVILTTLYECIKYGKTHPIALMLYAIYGYIPFFLFIDDQFMTLINTKTIYILALITFLYAFLTRDFSVIRKVYRKIERHL